MAGKIIYISGAYSSRWGVLGVLVNIWRARRVAKRIWEAGDYAICPHMNTALFPEDGIPYIKGDCEMVKRCDAIYLMRGFQKSPGAMIEYGAALITKKEIIFEVKE